MIVGLISMILGLFGCFTFLYISIKEKAVEMRLFWLSSGLFIVGLFALLT